MKKDMQAICMMILGFILRKDEASFYNYRKLYYVVFPHVGTFRCIRVFMYIYIFVLYVYLDIPRHCQFNLP